MIYKNVYDALRGGKKLLLIIFAPSFIECFTLCFIAIGLLSACTGAESGSLNGKSSTTTTLPGTMATVTSVNIKDKSLIIKGSKLDSITKVAVDGVSQNFQIDSQSAEEMKVSVASSLKLRSGISCSGYLGFRLKRVFYISYTRSLGGCFGSVL